MIVKKKTRLKPSRIHRREANSSNKIPLRSRRDCHSSFSRRTTPFNNFSLSSNQASSTKTQLASHLKGKDMETLHQIS